MNPVQVPAGGGKPVNILGIPMPIRLHGRDTNGTLSVVLTPAGFEGFFEQVGALTPTQQQDIPQIIALGQQYGLEFLPPA